MQSRCLTLKRLIPMPFAEHPTPETLPDTTRFSVFARVRTPQAGRILARWAGGLGLLVLLFGFLPWTQNIRSTGKLTTLRPQDRPQTVPSTIGGRIKAWRIQEGQLVKKGDTLAEII